MKRALLASLAVLGLLYGGAWLATPVSGIARSIAWLESDVGDINRFPAQTIQAGVTPRTLRAAPETPEPVLTIDDGEVTLEQFLDATDTAAFLVARGDDILVERYGGAQTAEGLHTSFSAGKSFLSAVLGAAVDRGLVALDDPITKELPELADRDARFADITVRDVVTMSSGIRYVERGLPWSDDALTYYAADLRRLALTKTRIAEPPGRWLYNNYNPLLIAALLERATDRPVAELLEEWIWQPAGMHADGSWSVDSTRHQFVKAESGVNATPRDFLVFGMLFRDGGRVEGREVLSRDWVETSTTAAFTTPWDGAGYGAFWWTGGHGDRRHFSARGKFGQYVFVFPEQDLVMVRLGPHDGAQDWPRVFEQLALQLSG